MRTQTEPAAYLCLEKNESLISNLENSFTILSDTGGICQQKVKTDQALVFTLHFLTDDISLESI